MAVSLPHRTFTADEFERMAEAGIFAEDERLELLDGEIVPMSPIGPPHAWCVKRLTRAFGPLQSSVILSVQDPIRLPERSSLQPDLALLRPEATESRHPEPADILLVIEVSDTTLRTDREIKAPLYGKGGIPELWIVDIGNERIEVHREPSPAGYRLIRIYTRGQQLSPLFAPELTVAVDVVLGSPEAAS